MKWWAIIVAGIWYLWRVYSLSYSPHEFPDPKYANKIWDRRSDYTAALGMATVTGGLYVLGIIHVWWLVLIVLVLSIFLVPLLQTGFIALIIYGRAAKVMLRAKMGLKLTSPWLAPFVWSYYLTPEEKNSGHLSLRHSLTNSWGRCTRAGIPTALMSVPHHFSSHLSFALG